MRVKDMIESRVNIVDYVSRFTELVPDGSRFKGKCPIHGSEESKTLVVYPHTNSYYCFSCSPKSPLNSSNIFGYFFR